MFKTVLFAALLALTFLLTYFLRICKTICLAPFAFLLMHYLRMVKAVLFTAYAYLLTMSNPILLLILL